MIRKVTHRACGSPGSLSVARQLVRPDGWIVPMPFQVVKLRARTPSSGMMPKATNHTNAGSAIQTTEPPRPPLDLVDSLVLTTGGAIVVTCR